MDVEESSMKLVKPRSYFSQRVCVLTTIVLTSLCLTLLFLMIMTLNGTLVPVRTMDYVRPSYVNDMNEYRVVSQTMVPCRENLPLRIHKLQLSPDPMIMPDGEFSNVDIDYAMTLLANVPEGITIKVLLQRLDPPWAEVTCTDGSGSCTYTNGCRAVGKVFGRDTCLNLKPGNYSGTVRNQLVDLMGPFQWAKHPGNYFAQVRANYREQPFACINMSFRIRDRP